VMTSVSGTNSTGMDSTLDIGSTVRKRERVSVDSARSSRSIGVANREPP
jgi:hypothetical protein